MNDITVIHSDTEGMREALKEAAKAFRLGEIPIGAIICNKQGQIIARAHNLRETTFDATAHAEIIAIEAACRKLDSWYLDQCTLYVTLEPCPMCAGAIIQSRIKNLYYGASDEKTGAVGSVLNLMEDFKFNHIVNVEKGILKNDCENLLKDFFRELRKSKKGEMKKR